MKFGIREVVLLLVLFAVPLASYWFVFRPQNHQIERAREEISLRREKLQKLQQESARRGTLEAATTQIAERISSIESRLPTNKELADVVRQISELANDAGLQQPSIVAEKPVKAALYMEQPLKISMTGDFRGFYKFLLELERLERITRLPDMTIKRSDRVDGQMQADFTLSIYFQDEEA
ncbi:MAG: type 4a pilus biogenesis protein PilO [Phycisphaeraceae bacterium]|nr:type 4a pilus biogenesis protein PilO [Phycisphaeraceae bacterium]